ncbi:hypothetical protein J3E68DRAFT_424517 [Trichoderma sp. SZMC 28012]
MAPFEPFFTNLAPDPSDEPITVTLKEYHYPEFFVFILDIIDEKLQPRLVPTEELPPIGHLFIQITQELKRYKIHEAGLDSRVNVCRLYGIVMDDCDFILGLLLTYVDCGDRPLSARVHPEEPDDPTPAVRERWMGQLKTALSALHQNRIVWGDFKAANVLIDEKENAWVVDFGGSYTEGWVDKEVAGTVMGDFTGMAKSRTLLFPAK